MQTIARLSPLAPFRRYRVSREQERALRLAEVQKEIAVKAIYAAGWQACERKLTGAAT